MKIIVNEVAGIEWAIESMRYSFNSTSNKGELLSYEYNVYQDDIDLLKKLILNGDSHAKVTRMIQVWVECTLPRYMWSELDTYKVATTAMSESTVHTMRKSIANGTLTAEDFQYTEKTAHAIDFFIDTVYNDSSLTTQEIKEMLPESFLQKRMLNLNYQTLRHIYFDRRNHRLPIWKEFLEKIISRLPFPELVTVEKESV